MEKQMLANKVAIITGSTTNLNGFAAGSEGTGSLEISKSSDVRAWARMGSVIGINGKSSTGVNHRRFLTGWAALAGVINCPCAS